MRHISMLAGSSFFFLSGFFSFFFCCYSFCKMDSRQSAIISGLFTQIEHISHNFLLPKLELLAVPNSHAYQLEHTHSGTHTCTHLYVRNVFLVGKFYENALQIE